VEQPPILAATNPSIVASTRELAVHFKYKPYARVRSASVGARLQPD
jgi:hypothetical protein